MTIRNNSDRAARAEDALHTYIGSDMPDESHPRDLITDLLHLLWARHNDPDLKNELESIPDNLAEDLRWAISRFNEEHSEENNGDQPLAVLETILHEGI